MMRILRRDELRQVQRTYGTLTVLASPKETANAVRRTDVKTLELHPGSRTSTHYHLLAESVFWIVTGEVDAICADGSRLSLATGDVLIVQPREQHCLVNRGSQVAIVVETQSPPYQVWDTFPNEKPWQPNAASGRKGRFWEQQAIATVRAKVCGIRSIEAAVMCAESGVAAIGLNLTYASKGLRALDHWLEWIPRIPAELSVFVLTDSYLWKEVEFLVKICGADTVQLQGPIAVEAVRELASKCRADGIRVVKSIGIDATQEAETAAYVDAVQEHVDALLLDSSWRGGTGKPADVEVLKRVIGQVRRPVILAGGLTADNVGEKVLATGVTAVDVESGVEVRLGSSDEGQRGISVKSAQRVMAFMGAIKMLGAT